MNRRRYGILRGIRRGFWLRIGRKRIVVYLSEEQYR